MLYCRFTVFTDYLCEFEMHRKQRFLQDRTLTIADFQQRKQWNTSFPGRLDTVTCPKGHATHTFLACDIISECWHADGRSGSGSARGGAVCSAPLNPLPPLFACRDKGQDVPYTLVCDHRSDCFDGSDEDFCVFHSANDMQNGFICSGETGLQCGQTHEVS